MGNEQLQKNNQVKELDIKNRKADYADLGIQRELRQQMQQDQQAQGRKQTFSFHLIPRCG